MAGQLEIELSVDDKGTVVATKYPRKAAQVMSQREFELLSSLLIKTCRNFSLVDCVAAIGKIIHQRRENRRKLSEVYGAVHDGSIKWH
jgi:hypothetical protein